MSEAMQLSTFRLAGGLYGLPVAAVQEILRTPRLTAVPMAPVEVVGLFSLRGLIVPVIDLRRRLALDPSGAATNVLVTRVKEAIVGLLVDAVDDVVTLDQTLFEGAPEGLGEGWKDAVTGVIKLADGLLIVLAPERLLPR